MLTAVRELQIPLLAALLLGGCAAKAWRALRTRSLTAAMVPTGLLPLRLRRPVMMTMCATELALGLALIATASQVGAGGAGLLATVVRAGTALLFLVAVGALNETRQRRPDAGCGCFGEFSDTPIGWRTITRAGVLCAAATVTIGLPPLRMPSSPATAELLLAALAFELSLIASLSPEIGEILVRLGYSEPCELRRAPGRPHADRAARERSVAPVRGPGLRRRSRRRVAGRLLALRGISRILARTARRHRLCHLPPDPQAAHPGGGP